MNYSDIVRLAAGLLQLGVACYALRLGRFFGKTRLRWMLYSGVPLLALAYLSISVGPFRDGNIGIKMDIIYGLFSLLLLAGMAHLEVLLKEHLRAEKTERDVRTEVDAKLKKHLADLTKANEEWPKTHEELKQTAARLEAELTEQKTAVAELTGANGELTKELAKTNEEFQQNEVKLKAEIGELNGTTAALQQVKDVTAKANGDLRATVTGLEERVSETNRSIAELTQAREALIQTNDELVKAKEELEQTVARLQGEIEEQKRLQVEREKAQQELVDASRQAGMSEVAHQVLKKVTGILDGANSVSDLATRLTESRIVPLVRISKLMWKQDSKPTRCPSRNPQAHQARQLPNNLAQLARNLSAEQTLLLRKIDSVKKRIESIKESVTEKSAEEPAHIESFSQPQPKKAAVVVAEVIEEVAPIVTETPMVEQPSPVSNDYALQVGETETATTETATAEAPIPVSEPEPQPVLEAAPQVAEPEQEPQVRLAAPAPTPEPEDLSAESFDLSDSF